MRVSFTIVLNAIEKSHVQAYYTNDGLENI